MSNSNYNNQNITASDLDLPVSPSKLRRTSTRLSAEYGKYSFSIVIPDLESKKNLYYIDNIIIQDMGEDLYATEKGKQFIMNEILRTMRFANDITIKL